MCVAIYVVNGCLCVVQVDELDAGQITVRDLQTRRQETVLVDDVHRVLQQFEDVDS